MMTFRPHFTLVFFFMMATKLFAQQDTTKYKSDYLYYNKDTNRYSINGHEIYLASYLKDNPAAWKEYEISSKKEGIAFAFTLSGFAFGAAALGQIGQKDNRIVPFAVTSAVSVGLAVIFNKISTIHNNIHMKKAIENYNQGILNKYAQNDSTVYLSKRIYYDKTQKTYAMNGHCFCLNKYLQEYPMAWKEYQLSQKGSNLSTLFVVVGLASIAAALGQIGQTNNRALPFVIGGIAALGISASTSNSKKSNIHLQNAVNYYNARR